MSKKLHIKTFGCQMNVYDSARMADILAPLGYGPARGAEDADMVILNTCHIREKAAEKVYSELGRLARLKAAKAKDGAAMIIAVGGCVGQAEGAEILRRAPCVDLVFGPQTYQRLPDMLAALADADRGSANDQGLIDIEFPAKPKFDDLPVISATGPAAFLTVQEGCDRFCAFCVVPYTRGAEFSRPEAEILDEARTLTAAGAKEITLLGQNVNAFHGAAEKGGSLGLGALIRSLAAIDGLARIRYTTSHPADMDDDLIAAHGEVPKLMPFLHLPLQSGSDRILRRMNRGHGIDDYRRVAGKLKSARPDLELSSDFITGFPGETEADFQATLDAAAEFGFIQAYSFKYSPRPGTPATGLPGQIADGLKEERLARLQAVLNDNQTRFNRASVGRRMPVLLDRQGRKPGQLAGRSPYMQPVHVDMTGDRMGEVVLLRIVSAHANSLGGVAADTSASGSGGIAA